MLYTKINVELVVLAGEVEAVIAGLNAALGGMEEKHDLFGGAIEVTPLRTGVCPGGPRSSIEWPQARARLAQSGSHVPV